MESVDSGQAKRINEKALGQVVADENDVTKNLQASFFSSFFLLHVSMDIIIYISIQGTLAFVNSFESYQPLVTDLHEQKSEFPFNLFLGLEKENFKGKKKELISCHLLTSPFVSENL